MKKHCWLVFSLGFVVTLRSFSAGLPLGSQLSACTDVWSNSTSLYFLVNFTVSDDSLLKFLHVPLFTVTQWFWLGGGGGYWWFYFSFFLPCRNRIRARCSVQLCLQSVVILKTTQESMTHQREEWPWTSWRPGPQRRAFLDFYLRKKAKFPDL